MGQNFFWPFLSKERLNLWAKNFKPKKVKEIFFSCAGQLNIVTLSVPWSFGANYQFLHYNDYNDYNHYNHYYDYNDYNY